MAVLDVIEDEGLLSNTHQTGDYLRDGIRELIPRHTWIGDVRGRGLLVGVELVRDRATREPAIVETKPVLDLMRQNGILAGSEGSYDNVLKIRPPVGLPPRTCRHLDRSAGQVTCRALRYVGYRRSPSLWVR